MYLNVWIPPPLDRKLNPTFGTQTIKEGVSLQNTIELERRDILQRQRGDWGAGGSGLNSGRGRGGRTEKHPRRCLYRVDFDKNRIPKLKPVEVWCYLLHIFVKQQFDRWTYPCDPWDCLKTTTNRRSVRLWLQQCGVLSNVVVVYAAAPRTSSLLQHWTIHHIAVTTVLRSWRWAKDCPKHVGLIQRSIKLLLLHLVGHLPYSPILMMHGQR